MCNLKYQQLTPVYLFYESFYIYYNLPEKLGTQVPFYIVIKGWQVAQPEPLISEILTKSILNNCINDFILRLPGSFLDIAPTNLDTGPCLCALSPFTASNVVLENKKNLT
jgi:hypothetical protein